MIGRASALPDVLPELRRYLLEYPNAELAGADSFFYWEKVSFGLKPTMRVNHGVIYRGRAQGRDFGVVAINSCTHHCSNRYIFVRKAQSNRVYLPATHPHTNHAPLHRRREQSAPVADMDARMSDASRHPRRSHSVRSSGQCSSPRPGWSSTSVC